MVHNGEVWFSRGVSDDEPFEVFRLFVENSQWKVLAVPNSPHLEDGLPSERLGTVRWMKSAHGFMYITTGGGKASRNGSVYCHNGFGWTSVHKRSAANVKLEWLEVSTADGTTVKLLWSERDSSAVSDTKFIDDIATNPTSGVAIDVATTGLIDFPGIDGGMPNVDGIMLLAQISADNLSATNANEFITMSYAGDDESRGANVLGDFLSGTKALPWARGAGISSRTLTPRLTLNRDTGDTTGTPQFRSLEIDYIKDPDVVESWRVTVDLVATAELQGESPETIITSLQVARDLGTLPSFFYGPVPAGPFFGHYLVFDGASGDVTVSDKGVIQNQFDGGAGLSARIFVDSDGEGDGGRIVDKALFTFIVSGESAGAVKLLFLQVFSGTNGQWTTTNTVVNIGEWYRVGVEYDNGATTNNPTIYVYREATRTLITLTVGNGLTEDATPTGTRTTDVGSDLVIGNVAADSSTFDGRIDDVRWYGTAGNLGSEDFSEELVGTETNLIHYWKFNEGSGTSLANSDATNTEAGTLTNATWGTDGENKIYVKVFMPEWEEEVSEAASEGSVAPTNTKAVRKGTVELILEERI